MMFEWQNRARDLADAHKKTESQKQRKKDVMAELNADLKVAETQETKLANIVATKREQREVIVEVVYNYIVGFVINTRTNTNEMISRRDRQTYDATMAQPVDRYREEHLDVQKEPTLWERIKAAWRG